MINIYRFWGEDRPWKFLDSGENSNNVKVNNVNFLQTLSGKQSQNIFLNLLGVKNHHYIKTWQQ